MKLLTKDIEEKLKEYPLGSQDGKLGNSKVIAKFFNPTGVGTWYIIEGKLLENGDAEMFGYCHLGDDELAEFGTVVLSELESIQLPMGMTFENGWERNEDLNLIQAMALTNVELDTLTDHERKVYFAQPIPPYSSGDWWILEDGTLKICQIGKEDGDYEKDDFIVSSKYVTTIATKTDNTITVLKGTVTKISENYVSVEDLATGGKTVINGANITTGQIDTDHVTVGNGNVQMNADGIQLKNGAKVVGEYGLMNTYLFENPNGFDTCGYEAVDTEPSTEAKIKGIKIIFNLPEKFNIVSAKVILHHAPTFWEWIIGTPGCTWGYCRNLKLYRATNINSKKYQAGYFSEYYETDSTSYEEIAGAFGQDGWTPTEPTELKHDTEEETSIDIKDKVSNGLNELYIRVSEEKTGYVNPNFICERTAFVNAMVRVDGYMSYD